MFSNPYATTVSSSYIGILILCVALLIASSSFSQEVFVDNGMYYKVTSAQTCKLIVNPSGGYGCNSGNQIVVPSSVVYQSNVYTVSEIGDSAFMSCECEEIVLPETITTLGKSVFADPTGVNKVFLQSSEPPQVDNYTFFHSNSRRISYYIHCDKYRTYLSTPIWSNKTFVGIEGNRTERYDTTVCVGQNSFTIHNPYYADLDTIITKLITQTTTFTYENRLVPIEGCIITDSLVISVFPDGSYNERTIYICNDSTTVPFSLPQLFGRERWEHTPLTM